MTGKFERRSPSVEVSRILRQRMTPEEILLWKHLQRKQMGVSFRRQEPMGRYVADFVCYECCLVIELDGSQHLDSQEDRVRDLDMAENGFETLRFWNSEVRNNLNGVLERIYEVIQTRQHLLAPPP
ncbi:DUF559 domain-containing protein [Deinococcus sp. Arct2-2]|uniref:endonuclease domain-containing protein n=1 Tax=Deinococcus sp. Arct2-2 TaxID=2568653 RepID=UPI0010A2BC77|nr:DUF559 domain-containing protein [Deinococcus sp. Arct2-2]THF71091.1 DUF559 domain-containing protein [Deinococcus sp. Arct2-2]